MAKAIAARQQGDDYQARWFWLEACRLFEPKSPVARVGFEVDGSKGFDDVATFYSPDRVIRNEFGRAITADFQQIKFHVSMKGAFTAMALTDPAFIGASKFSLLERLRDAQERHTHHGVEPRYKIVSPHGIDLSDKLSELVSSNAGALIFDRVFEGGDRSETGKIRAAWRTRLGVSDDLALKRILQPLRIVHSAPSMDRLERDLDGRLRMSGLVPCRVSSRASAYEDLVRKLLREGRTTFTREQLDEVLREEGLRRGAPFVPVEARRVGIRSFLQWAEHMEDETDSIHCLAADFEGRFLRDGRSWQQDVLPSLRTFLTSSLRPGETVHLRLDTHQSLAFASGWYLNSKSGVNAMPVQRTAGVSVWDASIDRCDDAKVWTSSVETLQGRGADVAVVLCVTHDIATDARRYIEAHAPAVGHVLTLTVCGGPHSTSVRNAAHALRLAQDAVAEAAELKNRTTSNGTTRIFAAGPNGLLFYLGQSARRLATCALYEFDFEKRRGGSYEQSVVLE